MSFHLLQLSEFCPWRKTLVESASFMAFQKILLANYD